MYEAISVVEATMADSPETILRFAAKAVCRFAPEYVVGMGFLERWLDFSVLPVVSCQSPRALKSSGSYPKISPAVGRNFLRDF